MNTSPFWMCGGSPIFTPHTLMVVKLMNIAIDFQGAFLGPLSTFSHIDRCCIARLHNTEPCSAKGLVVLPIWVWVQKVAYEAMAEVDISEAMGASMKAWQEPMHAAAKVAAVICPRYRVNRLQLIRIEVGAPEGLQRFIRVGPTNN